MPLAPPEISDNLLERIRRQEGLKTSADLFDLTTYHQLNEKTRELMQTIADTPHQIQLNLETHPDPESLEVLAKLYPLLDQTSVTFKRLSQELIASVPQITSPIANYIRDHNFDMPRFTIIDYAHAAQVLETFGETEYMINPHTLLLVFNLPKPIANWWYKGGHQEWGSLGVDIGEDIVPWGLLYRRLILPIWEHVDMSRTVYEVDLYRMNGPSDHKPDKYYYYWQVSKI